MRDIFAEFPVLDLGDVVLRELRVSDAEEFLKYSMDENIRKFTADDEIPTSLETAENDLIYWKNLFRYGRSIYWAITDKTNDKIIGSCGFNYWNKQHGRLEISYELNHKFWGLGIATKAVNAITDYMFKNTEAQRIQATVATDNERSIKLLERCGFKKEAKMAKYFMLRGVPKDGYMFARVA